MGEKPGSLEIGFGTTWPDGCLAYNSPNRLRLSQLGPTHSVQQQQLV